ncbi:unnamed protein product [Schistosoma rodhaini]|uniref:SET domain-containing protein n=1 Tax=Schistosoma rodhaini TaxID=6188 RepID=A0AA85GAK1_9TREM|nr:unnamed protein product [Schistosoma rodhaini]
MGRGLKAACKIQRGELVCVYLGEVIPYKEACLREAFQLSCYGRNFIMVMREYSDHRLISETCVDGNSESWGSVKSKARLINHSCTPNLTVVPVRVDSFIPYLALFANKVIFEVTVLWIVLIRLDHHTCGMILLLSNTTCSQNHDINMDGLCVFLVRVG